MTQFPAINLRVNVSLFDFLCNLTMAGVVLETLSWKKLCILGVSMLLLLLAFFLIGGLVGESSFHSDKEGLGRLGPQSIRPRGDFGLVLGWVDAFWVDKVIKGETMPSNNDVDNVTHVDQYLIFCFC